MKDRPAETLPPSNVGLQVEVHVLYRPHFSLEEWIDAIHTQPDETCLEAVYNAAKDRWEGDDAALWAIREATFYRKEGLRRNAPGVAGCFTPSAALVRAAPLLYAAARDILRIAAGPKPQTPEELVPLQDALNRLEQGCEIAVAPPSQPIPSQLWQGKSGYEVRNEREAWAAIQNGRPERDVLVKLARAARAADAQIMPDGTIAYAGNTLPDLDWNDRD
jgi:hypothetical protein